MSGKRRSRTERALRLLKRIEAEGAPLQARLNAITATPEPRDSLIVPSAERQVIVGPIHGRLESLRRRRRRVERFLRIETQAQHAKRHSGIPKGRARVLEALKARDLNPAGRNVAAVLAKTLKLSKRTVQDHLKEIRKEIAG